MRFLQAAVSSQRHGLPDLTGRTVGVVTGTAMGRLMPQVLETLAATTGGRFELLAITNTLFGISVTSAGLLPGRDLMACLQSRPDLDAALLPAEAVSDHGIFLDDVSWSQVVDAVRMPVALSYDFADGLAELPLSP